MNTQLAAQICNLLPLSFRCLLALTFTLTTAEWAHAAGGPGNALSFDGVNDSVTVPHTAPLNAYPITVTAWVKTSQASGAADLIGKWSTANDSGWQLSLMSGTLLVAYSRGNFLGVSIQGSGSVADGMWHHVAFTVNNVGGTLYLDGVFHAFGPWDYTPGAAVSSSAMRLGGLAFLNGQMDEVTVWNVALGQAQIQANKNRSLVGTETGLLAYYRCDENEGTTLFDSAPAALNNNGTLANGTVFTPSDVQPFTPSAHTLPATATGPITNTLNGTVNPAGANTTAWFEWGTTTNYGNLTLARALGSGISNTNFSEVLAGIDLFHMYHFRAVASNSFGISYGNGQSFGTFGFPSIRRLTNGPVEMSLNGESEAAYLVEASTNLAQWKLIDCLYASSSPARFVDPESKEISQRFYRYRTFPALLERLPFVVGGNSPALFRPPSNSSSTTNFLDTSPGNPDFCRWTNSFPAGISATEAIHVAWACRNGAVNPWLRLTTFSAEGYANPTIHFSQGLCFDFYSDRDLYLALGLRETETLGSVGSPGGINGPIEWIGGTVNNSVSPPRGRLITAGQWHRVCFFVPEEPVRGFTGNGVLTSVSGGYGVFEHVALVPVTGTGIFNIYFGEFHTMPVNP